MDDVYDIERRFIGKVPDFGSTGRRIPLKHQTKEIQTTAEPASATRNHIQFIEWEKEYFTWLHGIRFILYLNDRIR